ncbi:MAG: hypothetical protein IJT19_06635 [Bacteroidaceae bacterium]|nr:hypothetical protein [Bacteroidaceae bacterium]
MKKVFKSAMLVLAMLTTGLVTTSCDSETLQQIIGMLFNTGQTYTYSGSATSQSLTGSYNSGEWHYVNQNHDTQLTNMTVQLQSSTTGTLTLAPYTDGAVTVQQITIYNLAMTAAADQSYTSLSIGENSTIDGTIQYNGVTYTAANLYIEKAQATSGNISLKMTLYFQAANTDDYQMAINLTYTGAAVTTAQ